MRILQQDSAESRGSLKSFMAKAETKYKTETKAEAENSESDIPLPNTYWVCCEIQ